MRANIPSFGGDQFNEYDPTKSKKRSSVLNWLTVGLSIGSIIGLIFIVWIEDNQGWDLGLLVCGLAVLVGMLVMVMGLLFYRIQCPKGSPVTRMLQVMEKMSLRTSFIYQVFVAAFKKRRLILLENEEELHQVTKEEIIDGEVLPTYKGFKVIGYRSGITHQQRTGVSFIVTPVAACLAAFIEKNRKRVAADYGLIDSASRVPMSVMWLLLQFIVVAINDVFAFVGLLEFFNSETSRGMTSIGTAIFWCVSGLSSLLASYFL
ncbi:Proton-dependent oligopeptide transporter family [Cinnamomum micranthum f. kanehirae]|uniref:Proton-dependent oligopeptide transporter family n=1 Tax=Cinnamomum micranthum f. kanehirae TaxID=337451 RepID=A0A443PD95_9MAGN|nr:Proton-dependent oligopeptide transporter family [Cinnamomum micranthum f. kanehirae]